MWTFNPTMVWFYLSLLRIISMARRNFQSHYGLILSLSRASIIFFWNSSFNPTMVWFYHTEIIERNLNVPYFQSHYGLILSLQPITVDVEQRALSIPLWSDFIKSFSPPFISPPYMLSIPLWSDFIYKFISVITSDCLIFQSHYGLILSTIIYTTNLQM